MLLRASKALHQLRNEVASVTFDLANEYPIVFALGLGYSSEVLWIEKEKMSGQIFISYRRQESGWSARSLRDRLCRDFDPDQIFMDLDSIALGEDFVEAIETTVARCDVLASSVNSLAGASLQRLANLFALSLCWDIVASQIERSKAPLAQPDRATDF
ncbi:MAG: toll/interleukin-1 receptor domain-containing protein [Verrucomicrobia bacterium]|nr:toll/interleukin-1 receptor domain-containing protein [Verrucomicrobiota bacterium]